MQAVPKISSRDFHIGRYTCHRCKYLLWLALICNVSGVLYMFVDMYARVLEFYVFQWTFLSEVSGFGKFVMKWSSDPHLKHIFGFQPLRSLHLLLYFHELKGGFLQPFSFLCCLRNLSVRCEPPQRLHFDWEKAFSLFLTEFYEFK